MFESNVTVKSIIDELGGEADISLELPDSFYADCINSCEQLLYSDIIRMPKEKTGIAVGDESIDISAYGIRFEDIYTVFAYDTNDDDRDQEAQEPEYNDVELYQTSLTSSTIFDGTYYNDGGKLGLKTKRPYIRIVYFERPELKTAENIGTDTVKLPPEFIDIVKCRLRGEMYKAANEDALAAKWLNDYNAWIATFTSWLSARQPRFGI